MKICEHILSLPSSCGSTSMGACHSLFSLHSAACHTPKSEWKCPCQLIASSSFSSHASKSCPLYLWKSVSRRVQETGYSHDLSSLMVPRSRLSSICTAFSFKLFLCWSLVFGLFENLLELMFTMRPENLCM